LGHPPYVYVGVSVLELAAISDFIQELLAGIPVGGPVSKFADRQLSGCHTGTTNGWMEGALPTLPSQALSLILYKPAPPALDPTFVARERPLVAHNKGPHDAQKLAPYEHRDTAAR
jgi:hypothetical protein